MPHIFAGADRQQIDPEVLEAFKTLPDDFWVFAEFTISRNVDWFIIHPHQDGALALIVIELKRTGLPLAGDINNVWKQWTPEGWRDLTLNGPYRNYYWQAVEAANKLKEWLWNNQRRFRLGQDLLPQDAFKIWPDLLILSPPGTNHQLPLQPPNNFGKFIFNLNDCLRHITTWKSRQLSLVPLVDDEMLRLAEALGLERIWSPASHQQVVSDDRELPARVQQLEERVRQLEAILGANGYRPPAAMARESFLAPEIAPEWHPPADVPAFAPPAPPPAAQPPPRVAPREPQPEAEPPSLEQVFDWVEDSLRQDGHGQPLRLAELGNGLKNRHNFDARLQFGIPLSGVLNQLAATGRIRLSSRDRVPYASLASDPLPLPPDHEQTAGSPVETSAPRPTDPPAEPTMVRQKLGKDGLMTAVQIIAAVEDLAGGRVAQTASFLKHLRESLPLGGAPALSNGEANRLLREEFVALGYIKAVQVRDIDLTTGDLYTTEGYRLNRQHPAVRIMLDMGPPALKPEIEIHTFAGSAQHQVRDPEHAHEHEQEVSAVR